MADSEVQNFREFLRERFQTETEAASFIGGPSGAEALLGFDEFTRALRISGYRRAPERLFQLVSDDGVVNVRQLLRGSGLPFAGAGGLLRDAGSTIPTLAQQATLMPIEAAGALRMEEDLRIQVEELRRDLSSMRLAVSDSASREQLMEERSGRELGEGAMRQLSAKIEETLARETVALRADNADLRASLTECLRFLAEERKERQTDSTEGARRVKDLQHWAEERTQRLEGLGRTTQTQANENKTGLQEVEQLREMSEFRVLAAVAEESRAREASVQREQQARESMCAELEARWRGLLNEERALRTKESDNFASQLSRVEDTARNDREVQSQRNMDMMSRLDDLTRELRDEARLRSAEFTQLSAATEELRSSLQVEARNRRDGEDTMSRRAAGLESALESFMDRSDQEFSLVKQSILDLREASHTEATAREESCSRLQNLLDDEARAREEAVTKEAIQREGAEARLEQHWRTLIYEERSLREEAENGLEAKATALQHEFNFEKAKSTAQGRELSQAIAAAREALNNEMAARRHEFSLVSKGVEELRESLVEEAGIRERAEVRLLGQIGQLDSTLREEIVTREEGQRRGQSERAMNSEDIRKEFGAREELENQLVMRIEEERRLREDADNQEARMREENDLKNFAKSQALLNEEVQDREQGQRALEHRAQADEESLVVERSEREERDRAVGARLAEMGEDLSEVRQKLRDALQRCEELVALREGLAAEKAQRETDETELQLAVKEQRLLFEQLQQGTELSERRLDRRITDLADRAEQEQQERSGGDADSMKLLSEERQDRIAALQDERRRFEEVLGKVEASLQKQVLEERGLRELGDGSLDGKILNLSQAVDDARKWRIEQYNELVLELSKVTEMLTEEAKARSQQDQVIAGEVSRLREETIEETSSRKVAVSGCREEIQDVLTRLEREREVWMGKEKERWKAIEVLQDELSAETGKRDAGDDTLRQLIDREVLTREEVLAGATRAWQKANGKTNEEWRAAVRTETAVREEAQLRLEQQVVDVRSGVEESRSIADQRSEEVGQRFRAAAEALAVEDQTRKAEELLLQKATDDVARLLGAEQSERKMGEQMAADRFNVVEGSIRDEAILREDGERRVSKEIVSLQACLQTEQAEREEAVLKIERRIVAEAAIREEAQLREMKQREDMDADILAAWQRGLREEQVAREEDRKEIVSRLQQDQRDQQQERDDRSKADRELSASIARLQSLQKEEEENRIEQGERLGAALESLQDAVRILGPQREEILKKCMDVIDQVRGALNKEIVARTTKAEAIEEAVRDIRLRLADEVQQREAADRVTSEALVEEAQRREDAMLRERRTAEEEVQRALTQTRKAREEEERKLQEKILEVSSAVSEERDLRQEAIRQEKQKLVDAKEELVAGQRKLDNETTKLSNHMAKQFDADGRRFKEVDMTLANLTDKCDTTRADLANETARRETDLRNLEQRTLETQGLLSAEMKERRDMDSDLRKDLASEVLARDAAVEAQQREREAGDMQVANSMKAMIRDERETREAECAQSAKEFVAVKTQIAEESGHREDERSQQHLLMQKLSADIAELHGERKVDVVAMREAFGQVSEELKVAQRARKEDVDRLDNMLGTVSSRVDANSRSAREQCFALEQFVQNVQSELQKEVDERSAGATKLTSQILEEHRFTEAAASAEAKCRDELMRNVEELGKQRLSEEIRKQQVTNDKLASQILNFADDIERDRALSAQNSRDISKNLAALQGALSSEEQARQQNGWHLQQCFDLTREEVATEAKERRGQCNSLAEDITLLQRGLQKRDDRAEALATQLNSESNDLRERIIKEGRLRENALSQIDQQLINASVTRGSVPASSEALALRGGAIGSGPSGQEWNEYRRQQEEEKDTTRRQLVSVQSEQQALGKAVSSCEERYDTVRAGLAAAQSAVVDVQNRHKTFVEMEAQVCASRDEIRKETQERRAEDERLAAALVETDQRLERAEQQRVKSENSLRQEELDTKATLKKEIRDRELADARIATLVREEAQQREETVEREGRLRQEGTERASDAFHVALREERRVREKEDLRLEGRSLAPLGGKGDTVDGAQSAGMVMEQRALRQGVADLADRLTGAEARQRNAEERTVSMLDAIMSGLAQGPHD